MKPFYGDLAPLEQSYPKRKIYRDDNDTRKTGEYSTYSQKREVGI